MDRSTRFAWICITHSMAIALLVATAGRTEDGEALPPLVPIRDLLSDVNAPARRQVKVRGVVTSRGYTGLIIQDDSAGIWIDTLREGSRPISLMVDPEVLARLAPGQEVEVVGCTSRGGYSPNVFAETIRILGEKPEPVPRPVDQHRFFSGADDCQRVTVRGVVQGVRDGRIDWLLVTAEGDRPCRHRRRPRRLDGLEAEACQSGVRPPGTCRQKPCGAGTTASRRVATARMEKHRPRSLDIQP